MARLDDQMMPDQTAPDLMIPGLVPPDLLTVLGGLLAPHLTTPCLARVSVTPHLVMLDLRIPGLETLSLVTPNLVRLLGDLIRPDLMKLSFVVPRLVTLLGELMM